MKVGARDFVFLVPVLLLALWFVPTGRDRGLNQRIAVASFGAICVALAGAFFLSHVHHMTRPFVSDPYTKLLIAHSADNGFPSDHATVAFAAAGPLVWLQRPLGLVAL